MFSGQRLYSGPFASAFFLLLIALAFLPFLLRTGIDSEQIRRQAVANVYQDWRWSPEGRALSQFDTIHIPSIQVGDEYRLIFSHRLQSDFKVTQLPGNYPTLLVSFQEGPQLFARIESQHDQETVLWEGQVRMINNGFLLWCWLSLILILMKRSMASVLILPVMACLLWYSHWNPLEIPQILFSFFYRFFQETTFRFSQGQWFPLNFNFAAQILAVASFFLSLIPVFYFKKRKKPPSERWRIHILCLGFLVEPLFLYASSLIGEWSTDAVWWKVYLGSFAFRFFGVGLILCVFLFPREIKNYLAESKKQPLRFYWWAALSPLFFVLLDGWSWMNSVFLSDAGNTVIRLKIFFLALVLGFTVGHRLFSLAIASLALAILAPPTQGHWLAAAFSAYLFDGLMLGWLLSPHKGFVPVFNSPILPQKLLFMVLVTWGVGVLLPSVGLNTGFCWLLYLLGLWAMSYMGTQKPPQREQLA